MSYTHICNTASCETVKDFSLHQYVQSLAEHIEKNFDSLGSDLQGSYLDFDVEEIASDLNNYLRISDGKLLIEFDSEDANGDTMVWDWLCDQVRQDVMTSDFMRINYSSYDSRDGVDSGTSFFLKDGTFLGSDDIAEIVEQHLKTL